MRCKLCGYRTVAMMLLQRRRGQPLEEVLRRYAHQFARQPWDSLAKEDDKDGDTPAARRELLAEASTLLQAIFEGEPQAQPLLDVDLLSNLLGTFELVNMCISIPHPFNQAGTREYVAELLDDEVLVQVHTKQHDLDSDEESEGDGDDGGGAAALEEDGGKSEGLPASKAADISPKDAREAAENGGLFSNVIGTALVEAISFTNHSCLPNCQIDFATARCRSSKGPGLWAYSLARRPLIPGDEVLMSYVPSVVGKPYDVRQRKMREFGFECRCRTCVTDAMLIADGCTV
eukprot:gnl/TRDRNA2_/TRDRNA2_154042_c0_seq3.p1 gnl/TRDRNA2_/TRDRNA2_154042_c0~~gnl/TRDRNA2_/TRDRNA2_154042_c0_seq3.p1  ORF type:complete len:289 (-),score=67.10 gnl/TRDRNA2_/TRDRNA2_154042_c0_seq3:48-914(-)